jgi:hypothetical protein
MATQRPSHRVEVGTITTRKQPDEFAYPLRRDEFDALLEAETFAEVKRWRDIAFTSAVASFVGFLGTLACIDWDQVRLGQKWLPILFLALLGSTAVSSIAVLVVQQSRIRWAQDFSAFSRVKARILAFFQLPQ